MTEETTWVRFPADEYKKIPTESINFVGGEEGVFGTYQNGNQVHFLGGDDGAWWVMATYHTDWCKDIAKNIYRLLHKSMKK